MDQKPSVSRQGEIATGLELSLAAGLGMFPLGVAYGLLVVQSGLPWWLAPALSVAVFAGSMELLLIGLIATTAPLVTIAVTTFLVNFRHVFYAFTFPLNVVKNPAARTYSVYALTDEAYAVTAAKPSGWTSWRLISMQVAFQGYWFFGGLAGVALGSVLPVQIEGLEFALSALFITLTLDALRSRDGVPSLLLAASSFSVAALAFPDATLLMGLLLFMTTLVVRYFLTGERGRPND